MQVDINNLAGGAMAERINRELNKVAENVLDPNTKAEAVRTVTISIKIKPNEARQIGQTDIEVKSSLAPAKGVPTQFVFDFDREGNAVLKELNLSNDRDQMALNDAGDVVDGTGTSPSGKVVGMFK
ncbi:replication terminator protein [Paenibacillus sp. JNUCC31]|uniref:replication terminator protein n=1 Tax=Paenibacillus sp. JNUCC-31 TaxID=2777983 RepID=UPI00178110D1|nr:replication terminator protein [Paenibacillus sp. JNUCC-31]QOS77930.1 replication terminator protein [Paenibacillus sp. JNUCC-31]QOS77971.1 replication terminator protein [Paenibacillus sp. JNUCC-31]